jgi:hypothetical protein
VHLHLDLLAGQRALDEHHLAFGVVGDALPFEIERLDLQPLVVRCHGSELSGHDSRMWRAAGRHTGGDTRRAAR